MNLTNKLLLCALLATIVCKPARSQVNDSTFVATVSANITDYFTASLGKEAPVYNGNVHYLHPKFINGEHAFFIAPQYQAGTVSYEGYTYSNVKLMFDLIRGELLLKHFDNVTDIVLDPEKVDSFAFMDHNFINIKKEEAVNKNLSTGYYEVLYQGKIVLLAKRYKTVTEKLTQAGAERSAFQHNRYYLLKDSDYTLLKDKKSLTKLLKSTQFQNQQYIKSNQLNFRNDKENAILSLVRYHDSITK
jgi:hypothetical protein